MAAAQEQAALKRACCATWTHPMARLLLGERLHPGGERSTALTVAALGLGSGARVLDLGCGYGSALPILSAEGYTAIGLDLAREAAVAASSFGTVIIGDAESPPFGDESLDGIVIECVLSLLPDKRKALSHARRALKPGGRVAVSDVTIDEPLPLPLQEVATWSTCVSGALSTDGYFRLLDEAGFWAIERISLDNELVALIEQIRRRIALIEVALTARGIDLASLGLDRDRLETFRSVSAVALDFVRSEGAGYQLVHATKR